MYYNKHTVPKEKPSTLSQAILLTLFAAGALLVLSSPQGIRRLLAGVGYEMKRRRERERFIWSLAYLRRKQYLTYRQEPDGTIKIELLEGGKRRAFRYKLDVLTLPKSKRWDGKWRLIAFDVPEWKRKGRDALREKIKKLGMVRLQKSIWAWPYECQNEIDFLTELFGIGPYVHCFVTESITSEKFLKYKFNLR